MYAHEPIERNICQAVESLYCADQATKLKYSNMIVSYFSSQPTTPRKIYEYPFHLEKTKNSGLMQQFISNLSVFTALYTETDVRFYNYGRFIFGRNSIYSVGGAWLGSLLKLLLATPRA